MSITDELRNWMENAYSYGTGEDLFKKNYRPWFGWKLVLEPMLDRIDEAHKHAIAYVDDRDPEMMAEHGWIRLPLDSDGVPIHVGDVMEWCDPDGEGTVTCEVDAVGVECFFAWDGANGRYAQKCANVYRHHHPPTVEDVLEEFFGKANLPDGTQTRAELIAEYAAKLRLAGEDE